MFSRDLGFSRIGTGFIESIWLCFVFEFGKSLIPGELALGVARLVLAPEFPFFFLFSLNSFIPGDSIDSKGM